MSLRERDRDRETETERQRGETPRRRVYLQVESKLYVEES